MSEQGLETIESTTLKAHEWIARIAEALHMEKRDAYKSLRAVLITLRDRLPVDLAVHFGAQLPMIIRGLYYEGWEPSKVPVKMSRGEFLEAIREKIVAGRYTGAGEMHKVMHSLPQDMQSLFPALAAAALSGAVSRMD